MIAHQLLTNLNGDNEVGLLSRVLGALGVVSYSHSCGTVVLQFMINYPKKFN